YEQREFHAQHLILSSVSPRLSQKILNLTTAKEMWDAVKLDATSKSVMHQIDVLTQLQMMKCGCSSDPKTHLAEVKAHFAKMPEKMEYLRVTNSPVAEPTYVTMIMASMPETYLPI